MNTRRLLLFACALSLLGLSASFAQAQGPKMFGKGAPFTLEELPAGKLKTQLQALDPTARGKAMQWLHTLTFEELDAARHLRVDPNGGIYTVCADTDGCYEGHAHPPTKPTATTAPDSSLAPLAEPGALDKSAAPTTPDVAAVSVSVNSPPAYHSKPGAAKVIYLDFNGGTVSGTQWNVGGAATYVPKVWSQDADRTTFNDAEQTWMKRVWERVAEDYSSFDVDVTTDVAFDPVNYTGNKDNVGWLMICETTDNNGVALPHNGSGGVAYVGVFGDAAYSPQYQPAWVSSTNGGGNEAIVAEAASHEMGHNMGLNHDGLVAPATPAEYYGGHAGTASAPSWGPIMGTGYNRNVSQWSKGEYYGASQLQDDLATISGRVPYRTDDHGGTNGTATAITLTTGGTFSVAGIIERTSEVDVFALPTGAGNITINANPYKCAADTWGGNLDINLELYNSAGTLVASSNPASDVTGSITHTVTAGTYYVHVKPSAAGTPTVASPSGYKIYGSLGQYTVSGTAVVAGVAVNETGGGTAVTEGGATDTYSLVLGTAPTANVTVNIAGNAQLSLDKASVVFTPLNWNTPQVVTVTAVNDTTIEGPHTATITHTSSSTDARFNSISIGSVIVSITDNDNIELISPNGGETWLQGSAQTITWNSLLGGNVKIELLRAGVLHTTIAATTPNDGSHPWTVPAGQVPGTDYKIRITSVESPLATDTSATNFSIEPAPTSLWSQNFDASASLPTGWTSTASGAAWSIVTNNSHTPTRSAFATAPSVVASAYLTSEVIAIPATASSLKFNFYQSYNLEDGYDGGVLELSVDGGVTWFDVESAGSGASFTSNGYLRAISTSYSSPIGGRSAWTGNSGGYIQTVVSLTDTAKYAGKSFCARWRVATDNSTGSAGWYVDTVSLTGVMPQGLTVTTGDLASTGTYGGPFAPSSVTYTLTNNGASSLNWSASKTAAWLTLSSASGTLASGATTTVTVSINSSANTLAVGSYNDTVTFTNTTNGDGNTSRTASLTVNPIPVTVTLSNLNQTYNGTPRPVTVTTNPTPITYTVTYNGSTTAPTNAGTYAVVATVTQANYSGSASGSLVIAKANQTITFAALSPVLDTTPSIALTATASSGLPVSYTSSNPAVATISGSTANIVGLGDSTITASQAGNANYNAAPDVARTLSVVRANPLAVPGGPYKLYINGSLSLDGSGSFPSYGATITSYSWDLNNDNTFGDATGATPAAIPVATLTGTWGMVQGFNTIKLKITDSSAKTSTVSTTVELCLDLVWDSNGASANRTNGAGIWGDINKWWDGTINIDWIADANAVFGCAASNGAAVTLAAPTSVGSIVFNQFTATSTYTIGSAGQTITVKNGITSNAIAGNGTIISPLTLSANQTWANNSNAVLTIGNASAAGADTPITNAGFTITSDGSGQTRVYGSLSGTGGIIKNGSGLLNLGGQNVPTLVSHTYSGDTTINSGTVQIQGTAGVGTGNLNITGGVLQLYSGGTFTRDLGSAAGQIRITGGVSGFSAGGSTNSTFTITGTNPIAWGSNDFKPTEFLLLSSTTATNAKLSFTSNINLNGANRTVRSDQTGNDFINGYATLTGNLTNGTGTAGLVKKGQGMIILSGTNSYNGGTSLSEGVLRFAKLVSMPATGAVTVGNGTVLGISLGGTGEWTTGTSGNGTLGGLLAGLGGQSGGTVTYSGNVMLNIHTASNQTYAGSIPNAGTTLGLIKTANNTLTLSGSNSFAGPVAIYQGTISVASIGNVGGGNSNLGAPTTVANGTISIGNASSSGGTLTYTGTGETTNRVISLSGWNQGATLNHSGTGLLKFTSNITVPNLGSDNRKTLTLTGSTAGIGEFAGAIIDAASATNFATTVSKSGTGTWILSGANTYTGATNVTAGKLFINGSNSTGTVTVSTGATLGGSGSLGGSVTINTGGKLEFNINTNAASHNPLDLAAGKTLTFAGTSELTITSTGGASAGDYVLMSAPAGITGTLPAVVNLPTGWTATLSVVGTNLVLSVSAVSDVAAPTLTSIADNKSGGPIAPNTLVTYTVTFSEDIDSTTVSAADFGNAGTSTISIGTIAETSANSGVFTVQVTPTTPGTLRLRVNAGATINDASGNSLVTSSALLDDTTITVDAYASWSQAQPYASDANGDGVENGLAWLFGAADPWANAIALQPTSDSTSDANYLIFTYRRSDVAFNATNVTIAAQYGSTITSWTDAVHDGTNIIITSTNDFYGAGVDKVEVKIKKTLAASGKLFARVSLVVSP